MAEAGLTESSRGDGVLAVVDSSNGKLSFWRPLSAATHWIDYHLWPTSPALMRLHNAAWFARISRDRLDAVPGDHEACWVVGLAALILASTRRTIRLSHGLPRAIP